MDLKLITCVGCRDSIPGWGTRFFIPVQRPHLHWSPPCVPWGGYRRFFLRT